MARATGPCTVDPAAYPVVAAPDPDDRPPAAAELVEPGTALATQWATFDADRASSYLDEIRILRRELRAVGSDALAFAHITGGGWVDNIPRTLPAELGVDVELGSWPVPLIFSLIQERGDIADDEMVRAFNLGIGLTCVVRPEHEQAAREALPEMCRVGTVVRTAPGGARVTFA